MVPAQVTLPEAPHLLHAVMLETVPTVRPTEGRWRRSLVGGLHPAARGRRGRDPPPQGPQTSQAADGARSLSGPGAPCYGIASSCCAAGQGEASGSPTHRPPQSQTFRRGAPLPPDQGRCHDKKGPPSRTGVTGTPSQATVQFSPLEFLFNRFSRSIYFRGYGKSPSE